jgi:hypothetical protein
MGATGHPPTADVGDEEMKYLTEVVFEVLLHKRSSHRYGFANALIWETSA